MKWVFSALVVLWSLRAIEGPASADLWPNDVFTKIAPRKVAKWRLSNPIAVGPKRPRRCCSLVCGAAASIHCLESEFPSFGINGLELVSLNFASWNRVVP